MKYTEEMRLFVKENINGTSYKDMTQLFNLKFNQNLSVSTMKSYIQRCGFKNNRDTTLKKGNIPHNKGKKGVIHEGCQKGWLPKGNIPSQYRPVGSERTDKDGYVWIKVGDPNKWRQKNHLIWESAYGEIPKNHVVIFLDGDKSNLNIDNLKLVTRQELLVMNRNKLFTTNADFTNTGNILAKIILARSAAKKANKAVQEIEEEQNK